MKATVGGFASNHENTGGCHQQTEAAIGTDNRTVTCSFPSTQPLANGMILCSGKELCRMTTPCGVALEVWSSQWPWRRGMWLFCSRSKPSKLGRRPRLHDEGCQRHPWCPVWGRGVGSLWRWPGLPRAAQQKGPQWADRQGLHRVERWEVASGGPDGACEC